MGNSPLASLQHGNGDQFYQVQLGESTDLYFRRIEVKRQGNGKITEAWLMSYQVDMSTCNFALTKAKVNSNSHDPHHDDGTLDIKILDDAHGISRDCFSVTVQRAKAGRLLHPTFSTGLNMNPRNSAAAIVSSHSTITTNSRGGITETSFDIYGSGTRRGLTVREWEKNSKDEKPYMGTVAHYYAYKGNGKDVGLSVVAKRIRVSEDGQLDFDVDGPQQHPAQALFFMFDEVLRTRTWKPTYCPHCANACNCIIHTDHMFWLSKSEDSDEAYQPAALVLGRRQNAGRIINNCGVINGSHNGNILNLSNKILTALLPGRNKNAGGIIANGGVIKGNHNGNLPISKGRIVNDGVIKGNVNINGNLFIDKLIIVHEVNLVSTKYGENSTDGLSNKILEWWAYAASFIKKF